MLIERLERVALLGSAWVLYLLMALSLVSLSIMIERWAYFRARRGNVLALGDTLIERLGKGDRIGAEALLIKSPTIEAAVLRRAFPWIDGGPSAVSEALESAMGRQRKDLEKGMTFLGTLGNNAPFVGLLGTVLGVIQAFHQLGDGQNKAAMGNVMSGIAEALIATGVGLVVALPAVVAYNIFQGRIGEIEGNVGTLGKQLLAFLAFQEHRPRARAVPVAPERAAAPQDDDTAPQRRGVSGASSARAQTNEPSAQA
ncbi:MAG: MotA/TolQ/ExbB proton channel family protein [Byssovorax sp.]